MKHWPLEPLMALARTRDGERMSMVGLSKKLGYSDGTVQAWAKRGIPGDAKAEAAAVAVGFDPYVVWPEWADAQWESLTKPCARCGERFIVTRKDRIYCSVLCKNRVAQSRWVKTPSGRAHRNAKAKRYYQETAEYAKRRAKARYWANREAELERFARYREANRVMLAEKARERRARKRAEAIAQASGGPGDGSATSHRGPQADETVAA